MNLSEELIKKSLSRVIDPDLHKDLVSLGMIQNIKIEGNYVYFELVLTTPACPLKNKLKQECIESLKKDFGKDIQINVEIKSKVLPHKSPTRENTLPEIKNIIAIYSAKGGVGKSTIAANLAIALGAKGAKTGLFDADIYGPSIPILFDLENEKVETVEFGGKLYLVPFEKCGIKIISIGFVVTPDQALLWRGPMASNALKQLLYDTQWEELDYLIIDMPPGTGDIPLTLFQTIKISGVIIVTTPHLLAIAEVKKALSMLNNQNLKTNILGIIENMSYFSPNDNPEKKYYLFGTQHTYQFIKDFNIELLGEIPIDETISKYNCNNIFSNNPNKILSTFSIIAEKIAQKISIQNFNLINN